MDKLFWFGFVVIVVIVLWRAVKNDGRE